MCRNNCLLHAEGEAVCQVQPQLCIKKPVSAAGVTEYNLLLHTSVLSITVHFLYYCIDIEKMTVFVNLFFLDFIIKSSLIK
jgi:hypothetical protein